MYVRLYAIPSAFFSLLETEGCVGETVCQIDFGRRHNKTPLSIHSYPQLAATFEEYKLICKYDMRESVKREFSMNYKSALLAIVDTVRDPTAFFAARINKATAGTCDGHEKSKSTRASQVKFTVTIAVCESLQLGA